MERIEILELENRRLTSRPVVAEELDIEKRGLVWHKNLEEWSCPLVIWGRLGKEQICKVGVRG